MLFNYINFLNEGEQDEEYDKMNSRRDGDPDPKFTDSSRNPAYDLGAKHWYDKELYKGDERKKINTSLAKYDKAVDKEVEAEIYAKKKTEEEVRKRNINPEKDPKQYNDIFDSFYRNKMRSIKHESSIFESVVFLNEGEQAEEYKKRKNEEAAKKEQEEKEREERRYGGLEKDQHHRFVGNQSHIDKKFSDMSDSEQDRYRDRYMDKMSDDERRASAAAYVANRNRLRGDDFNKGFDAINKDMRRHPERWKK